LLDALIDRFQMPSGYLVSVLARAFRLRAERKQFPDVANFESKVP
jgi:hypothetical protein